MPTPEKKIFSVWQQCFLRPVFVHFFIRRPQRSDPQAVTLDLVFLSLFLKIITTVILAGYYPFFLYYSLILACFEHFPWLKDENQVKISHRMSKILGS